MSALRSIRLVLWLLVALAAGGAVAFFVWGNGVAAAAIGGPFELTDQNGGKVTEAALAGHPSAMFFGYTYCPDVCPTTLSDLTQWIQELGPAADRLKVFFVTVDPERDTQEQMAAYLKAFDPRITGLTGSRAAIDSVLKEFRVFSRKVEQPDGAYLMDHSASVYLFDENTKLTSTVDYKDDPAISLAKLKRLVGST